MTPKKQAEMLINKFNYADEAYYHECFKDSNLGKICALVAVDEILAVFYDDIREMWLDELNYWHQVKKEIEAL